MSKSIWVAAGAAHLDRVDHEVGAGERLQPVEVTRSITGVAPRAVGRPRRHPLRGAQPLRVDVVEHELRVAQRREGQDVAEQVARELDAAGADEHDPGHGVVSSPAPRMCLSPWLWYRSIQAGRSGFAPRRRASAKASRATGGTADSEACASVAVAGSGRSADPGWSRPGPTSIVVRAPRRGVPEELADGLACGSVRRERDDDGARPEHRGGPGGHLPHLGALGVDEGHLLELERRLQRGRVREAAAGDEQVVGVGELVVRAPPRAARRRSIAVSAASAAARRSRPERVARCRSQQLEQQQLRRGERRREGLGHDGDGGRAAART